MDRAHAGSEPVDSNKESLAPNDGEQTKEAQDEANNDALLRQNKILPAFIQAIRRHFPERTD